MTSVAEPGSRPPLLLLATDLSARCDRALDRAAQLSGEWQARLVAMNVLDPAASPDSALAWLEEGGDEHLLQLARQELANDLAAANVTASVRQVRGKDVSAAIRQVAAEMQAGLVIAGVSGEETLARFLPGSTVKDLARTLSQPLLVVRKRARAPYRRIVVATDFSASSRQALATTARLFPGRELILYHAQSTAPAGLSRSAASPAPDVSLGVEKSAAFLADTFLPEGTSVRSVIERGVVESALTRYVRAQDIELVVVGCSGQGSLLGLLLGSTASKLLDWLPCDMMLIGKQPFTS